MADTAEVQQQERGIAARKTWILERSLNAAVAREVWTPSDHANLVHHIAEIERTYMALVRASQQANGGRS
jgi:hypothetical protein